MCRDVRLVSIARGTARDKGAFGQGIVELAFAQPATHPVGIVFRVAANIVTLPVALDPPVRPPDRVLRGPAHDGRACREARETR